MVNESLKPFPHLEMQKIIQIIQIIIMHFAIFLHSLSTSRVLFLVTLFERLMRFRFVPLSDSLLSFRRDAG